MANEPGPPPRRTLVGHAVAMARLQEYVEKGLTDPQVQAKLKEEFDHEWHIDSIRRARKAVGVSKEPGRPAAPPRLSQVAMTVPPPGTPEAEKPDWFRRQFMETHLYTELQRQFKADEVSIYLEEFGSVCLQFSDIVSTEFFQIDDFLKHRLLLSRCLKEQKEVRAEIEEAAQWLRDNPPKETDSPEAKKIRLQSVQQLDFKRTTLSKLDERYDKLVAARDKIYAALSATRRDRIDQLRSGNESFFTLVASMVQDAAVREENGRYAELTRIASQDIADEWHKPTTFPDGKTDVVLLDDEAELEGDFEPVEAPAAEPAREEDQEVLPEVKDE